MSSTPRQMKLGAFCGGSYHQGGWRHPRSGAEDTANIGAWVTLAKRLEAAKFDMMFVADTASPSNPEAPEVFRYLAAADNLEPMTLLAAVSQHTRQLGLAGTIATSYRPPYDVAREALSLDVISGGRFGWNVVTGISPDDAAQYADQSFPPIHERYAKGDEFVDVVLKLWASIEPGAYVRDRAAGIYKNIEKIHIIRDIGKYYNVRGPLKGVPSPQGRPLLIQAGQSPDGRAMASRIAEAIFTAQSTFAQAKTARKLRSSGGAVVPAQLSGATRQSGAAGTGALDCFATLAMTKRYFATAGAACPAACPAAWFRYGISRSRGNTSSSVLVSGRM